MRDSNRRVDLGASKAGRWAMSGAAIVAQCPQDLYLKWILAIEREGMGGMPVNPVEARKWAAESKQPATLTSKLLFVWHQLNLLILLA